MQLVLDAERSVPNSACHRYPGGLKERSARSQHGMDPTSVLWKAVNGMLPKNKLRQVFGCACHEQVPCTAAARLTC